MISHDEYNYLVPQFGSNTAIRGDNSAIRGDNSAVNNTVDFIKEILSQQENLTPIDRIMIFVKYCIKHYE